MFRILYFFPVDPRVVVTKHIIFLEAAFIQEDGMGKKVDLVEEWSFFSQIPDQITEHSESSQINDPQSFP